MPGPAYRINPPPLRPVVLFDGECRFCQQWAGHWRQAYGARLDVVPSQSGRERFPEIPAGAYDDALQLIEADGAVYAGAWAVLRARALGRGSRGPALWCYETIPGAALLAETGYRIVARHRRLFSMLMR